MPHLLPQHQLNQTSRGRLLGKFLIGELVGRPRVVNIELTLRCNARCDFCGYWHSDRRQELTDLRPIVEQFLPLAVNLTGGEPLLRRDLPQLITQIKTTSPTYVSLLTNGALLTLERAAALRDAGLDGLSVSLNYLGQRQDQERHLPGLYQHLAELLPQLPRLGFSRIGINTVILGTNLDQLIPLAELTRRWGVGFNLSCYSAGKNGNSSYALSQEQQERLPRVIATLKRLRRCGYPIDSSDWYLDQVPRFYRDGGIPGCEAGRKTIHLTPDGMVKPCPDLPVVCHFSNYNSSTADPVSCTSCWYRCRGEVEAPLTPARLIYYTRHWQRSRAAGAQG